MTAKITLDATVEIESSDERANAEVKQQIELQIARIGEQLEAILLERVQPLHPDLKFIFEELE